MKTNELLIERSTKALHSSQFLVGDLQELLKYSQDPLLADAVLQEIPKAVALEARLKQLVSFLEQREKTKKLD